MTLQEQANEDLPAIRSAIRHHEALVTEAKRIAKGMLRKHPGRDALFSVFVLRMAAKFCEEGK